MVFHSDEDESEEDEEELLRAYSSPEQSPSSSPERFTLDSIFDMNVKLPSPEGFGDKTIDMLEQDDYDEHYDPTFSWVNQIYQDSENDDEMTSDYKDEADFDDFDDIENRLPAGYTESLKRGKTRSWACSNSSPTSSSSPESRTPLQELPLDESDDDDLHPRKKVILNKKSSANIDYRDPLPSPSTSRTKKSFMRALSPASGKGKEPATN